MLTKKLLWLMPLLVLASCGQSGSGNFESATNRAATEANNSDTSAIVAATAPINSPERKVIHTADFNCQVKDVFVATTVLENLVKSVGGIVQESHIDNSAYEKQTSYYTADSLRETATYTTTSRLTLRVPVLFLDSVVNAIPLLSSFIDSRTLKQNDVTYQYLANVLKNQVGTNNNAVTKAMNLAKKSHEPIQVQNYDDSKQEQKIDRKIENLNLSENVAYATLTVAFSQPEQVYMQTIVNTSHLARTPFLLQCKSAMSTGWELILSFVVVLIKIWPVIVIGLTVLIIYKKSFRRNLTLVKK